MRTSVLRLLLICLVLLFGVGACKPEAGQQQQNSAAAAISGETVPAQDDIPLGQLPAEVQPLAYQLELTIIPGRDRFSPNRLPRPPRISSKTITRSRRARSLVSTQSCASSGEAAWGVCIWHRTADSGGPWR